MTYAEAFSKIKKKLAKADTKGFDGDFAVQVTIKDEDAAGTFYCAFIDGEFSVEPYDYRDNSAAVDVTVADFIKLVEGKTTAQKLLDSGKLDIFGNIGALEMLGGTLKTAPRKKAAKKETAKKETTKKEAVKKETAKKEAVKKETAKKEAVKKETTKKEAPKAAEKKADAKAAKASSSKKADAKTAEEKPAKATAKKTEKKAAKSK